MRPADFVSGREGLLDDPEPVVGLGLQFQDDAAVADALGFQDLVVFAPTVNVGDRVARAKRLYRHEFAGAKLV